MECAVCHKETADVYSAIDDGWIPEFYRANDICDGPACCQCVENMMVEDEDGEFLLIGKDKNQCG